MRLARLFLPGMGLGPLPGPGGSGDQGAWLMDALGIVARAWKELEPKRR